MVQLEVGFSGWKSIVRRVVFGAFSAVFENSEDRVSFVFGRIYNRIRFLR